SASPQAFQACGRGRRRCRHGSPRREIRRTRGSELCEVHRRVRFPPIIILMCTIKTPVPRSLRYNVERFLTEGATMSITVRAVYESGVLRPLRPLPLAEGETVDVTVAAAAPARPSLRARTPAEQD